MFVAPDELVLEFEKLLIRQPVPPTEKDIVFTQLDLAHGAGALVRGMRP